MSEFDPGLAKKLLPEDIEHIKDVFKRQVENAEGFLEEAKQTNIPELIRNAEAIVKCFSALRDDAMKMCGNEGDTASGEGTFWGVYNVACQTLKALGGDE